jgi:hypothetical protein
VSFFGPNPLDWRRLGHELGLDAYWSEGRYYTRSSFLACKRAFKRKRLASDPPSFEDHLYGTMNGMEAIAMVFDTGQGSSQSANTGVLFRIDPSLFLGMSVTSHAFIPFFESEDIKIGDSKIDDKLLLHAFDREHARQFFRDQRELIATLPRLAHRDTSFMLTDTGLSLSTTGIHPHAEYFRFWAGQAKPVVQQLSVLGTNYPRAAWIRKLSDALQDIATRVGADFDVYRMRLTKLGFELALEFNIQSFRMEVEYRFRTPLPVSFSIRPTLAPALVQKLLLDDIELGHHEFDTRFLVLSAKPQEAKALLRKPRFLTAMMTLSSPRVEQLTVNEYGLSFSLIPNPANPAEDAICCFETVMAAVYEFEPSVFASGYR